MQQRWLQEGEKDGGEFLGLPVRNEVFHGKEIVVDRQCGRSMMVQVHLGVARKCEEVVGVFRLSCVLVVWSKRHVCLELQAVRVRFRSGMLLGHLKGYVYFRFALRYFEGQFIHLLHRR